MTTPQAYIDRQLQRFQAELFDFLRIPSVSARSEHDADTRRAADWLAGRLRAVGLQAEIVETARHPVVLAQWRGAGRDAPTVLVYGHYDVQPPDPLELWTSPPFEPTVRDGRVFARGAADDKGQVYLHVAALEAYLANGGRLPVNIVLVAEGEEEIGSPNLVPFVERYRERLACNCVVISDTGMFAPDLPTIVRALRGLAYLEIQVEGPRGDLHSGTYGGAVVNPATALARIIAAMHDENWHIAVPGFYGDVRDWDENERAVIRALPFTESEFRAQVGSSALDGEAGYSTLERLWTRPTCEVNGLLSGYTGEGAKTVLPARAMAKVSFRLVPDQDPARVGQLVREYVNRIAPKGVRVTITELHGGRPWRAAAEGPYLQAAARALERTFGRPPVYTGEGGSIPIVGEFERILGAPVVLLGFALPGANMHAPDEWFALESFEKGMRTIAYLYEELAG
ncbi:MAG: dipeptidase [Gemmatimonadetes bacterium]|nr:dipeptidase [Gemmatimonadota bacterium]